MAAVSQKMDAMAKRATKNMALWDWIVAKLSLLVLGILIVRLYPDILNRFAWVWWFIIFGVLAVIPLVSTNKKPLLKKNQTKKTDSYPMKQFRMAKQNLTIIDWALAKSALIILGIALCTLYPIQRFFIAPIWLIIWLVLTIIPMYFVYDYTPQKKTPFSQMRAQYTRSKLPMTESAEKRAVETFRGDKDGISRMVNWRRAVSKKTTKKRQGKKPGTIQLFPNRKK